MLDDIRKLQVFPERHPMMSRKNIKPLVGRSNVKRFVDNVQIAEFPLSQLYERQNQGSLCHTHVCPKPIFSPNLFLHATNVLLGNFFLT